MKTANKLARILYKGGVAIDVTTLENELRAWKNEILEKAAEIAEAEIEAGFAADAPGEIRQLKEEV